MHRLNGLHRHRVMHRCNDVTHLTFAWLLMSFIAVARAWSLDQPMITPHPIRQKPDCLVAFQSNQALGRGGEHDAIARYGHRANLAIRQTVRRVVEFSDQLEITSGRIRQPSVQRNFITARSGRLKRE